MMDWNSILLGIIGIFAGVGFWAWVKAREDKRKTPYDMLKEMLLEQKKFYEERNADYEREKLDSAEKSAVISKSQFCQHKYNDPSIVCPVDKANVDRLEHKCSRCEYNKENEASEPINN